MGRSYDPADMSSHGSSATFKEMFDRPHPMHVALVCSYLGLRVFPFHFDGARKRPSIREWPKRATSDPVDIQDTWAEGGTHGGKHLVGVLTGCDSNEDREAVWVLDLDKKNGVNGFATLAELEVEHGPLPRTFTVRTATGGQHRYFRWPSDGREVHSSEGALGPGIDVKGWHSFVVAPLTTRTMPSGWTRAYEVIDPHTWVNAPAWLLDAAIEAGADRLGTGSDDASGDGDPLNFDTWVAEAVTVGGPNASAKTSQDWYLFRGLCSMRARDLSRDDMIELGWNAARRFTTYDAADPWIREFVIEKVDYVRRRHPAGAGRPQHLTDLLNGVLL
jgi:hypothetical protein